MLVQMLSETVLPGSVCWLVDEIELSVMGGEPSVEEGGPEYRECGWFGPCGPEGMAPTPGLGSEILATTSPAQQGSHGEAFWTLPRGGAGTVCPSPWRSVSGHPGKELSCVTSPKAVSALPPLSLLVCPPSGLWIRGQTWDSEKEKLPTEATRNVPFAVGPFAH